MKLDVYEYEETFINKKGEEETYTCSFSIKSGLKSPIDRAVLVDTFDYELCK